MVSTLDIKRDGGVACITLNRSDKRNAINDAMRDELVAAFAGLDEDASIRVAILTGAPLPALLLATCMVGAALGGVGWALFAWQRSAARRGSRTAQRGVER